MSVTVRVAAADEVDVVADIFIAAREQAAVDGTIPPMVGTHDGAREYWRTVFAGPSEVYLADDGDEPVALLCLEDGWLDQLYVRPGFTNRGIGTQLLNFAKARYPAGLQLWAFQSNAGARRFYERHGFVDVEYTDGDNMERAPDVRYVWAGSGAAPSTVTI